MLVHLGCEVNKILLTLGLGQINLKIIKVEDLEDFEIIQIVQGL